MARIPQNVIAVSEDALDPDLFLGRLALYTLPDQEVPGSKLLRSWAGHGLDPDILPEARQPVHIFQSACASVKRRRVPTSVGSGDRMQITADEVADNGTCDYQIGVKVWDIANKVIEYRRDMLADLYGDDADFHIIPLANADGEREMVRRHFVINANERAAQLSMRAINRLREGSGKRSVRSDLMTNLWNERRELLMAVDQFHDLVEIEQKDLQANLRELDESLMKLQDFADKEAADKP
jgi:hypothetical protein